MGKAKRMATGEDRQRDGWTDRHAGSQYTQNNLPTYRQPVGPTETHANRQTEGPTDRKKDKDRPTYKPVHGSTHAEPTYIPTNSRIETHIYMLIDRRTGPTEGPADRKRLTDLQAGTRTDTCRTGVHTDRQLDRKRRRYTFRSTDGPDRQRELQTGR